MKRIDCFKVLIESEIVPVIGNSQATLSSWLLRELIDEIWELVNYLFQWKVDRPIVESFN